ncbi:MAG: hypothetical protein GDA52_07485 [Rhodobacteraceae bacterium]|nr:hypothetical protein [Paracoccaceae bacterium]
MKRIIAAIRWWTPPKSVARTAMICDDGIFVLDVQSALRICSGETNGNTL